MDIADYSDNLRVSDYMGKIVAVCLVLIVLVFVIRAIRRVSKK